MTAHPQLDQRRLDEFERSLLARAAVRAPAQEIWRALAQVFPHRTPGPAERRLLLDALKLIEVRGRIRLPPEKGRRWDRSMEPAVPTSVDVVREEHAPSRFPWRTFPWHPRLHWVAQRRRLSATQIAFLRHVHEGLVNGAFKEAAPMKYRSLQLTGDEKMLAALSTTSLFGDSRLTLELLGCLPDALPLAWEAVSEGGRVLIFENAGPFAVARRVLTDLKIGPYDIIAYGGGRSVLAALGHLKTIGRPIASIHYVGDLDYAGLDIACGVRIRALALGLPAVAPASELHKQMLLSAKALGHPQGWRGEERFPASDRRMGLHVLAADVRDDVALVLQAGRRIPEEVLGPDELRNAWVGTSR